MSEFWIKTTADGQAYGPYTPEALRQYATEGRIRPDSLISKDQVNWHPAAKVKGLFPEQPAAVTVAAQAAPPVVAPAPAAATAPAAAPSAAPEGAAASLGYYVKTPTDAPVDPAATGARRRSIVPFLCAAVGLFLVSIPLTYLLTHLEKQREILPLFLTSLAYCALAGATLVLWLMWIGAAHADLRDLSKGTYKVTPGSAVGLSFIPFFNAFWNVYMPSKLAQEANRHLAARGLKTIPTGALLVCQIVSVVSACLFPGLIPLLYAMSMWLVQGGFNRLAAQQA